MTQSETRSGNSMNHNKNPAGSDISSESGISQAAKMVTDQVRDTGASVAKATHDAWEYAGDGATAAMQAVRENAGAAAGAMADAGKYVIDQGIPDLNEEVSTFVRKYPIPAVLCGMGVGLLIGAALARR